MRKLLITNIIIGSLFGVFVALAIWILLHFFYYYVGGVFTLIVQSIAGFLLSIPIMVIMWEQTKKINDKSILFLGGPVISIFAALFYFIVSSQIWPMMTKEAPYILLAFILFYCLLQLAMYNIVKTK